MKDVMIDIETLATRNDAAIIQIGAVAFDPQTDEIGQPFLVSVDQGYYDDPESNPFYTDDRTREWWATQPKEAQQSLKINCVATPFLALDRMVEWFEEEAEFTIKASRRKSSSIWANPPQFDLSIIRYAASKAYGSDNDVPWKHWQETDMRTLVRLAGHANLQGSPVAAGLIKHRADHDAIRQALIVQDLIKRIKV